MQIHLDDLISQDNLSHPSSKKQKKSRNFLSFSECINIALIIISSFLIGNIITNAGLYAERISDLMFGTKTLRAAAASDHVELRESKKKQYLNQLFAKKTDTKRNSKDEIYAYYKDKAKSLAWQFNTLPPDRRIEIPGIGTQAPIVTVEGNIDAKMEDGEFSEELKKGVASYPNTPSPNQNGMMMIFGHTSNYSRIKSDYNHIFSKIPQLKHGDIIKVFRDGKVYEYKVTKQEIVKPDDVPKAYAREYDPNRKKLMLMGCYPVGTRTNRVLVYAEPKNDKATANTNLAYETKGGHN